MDFGVCVVCVFFRGSVIKKNKYTLCAFTMKKLRTLMVIMMLLVLDIVEAQSAKKKKPKTVVSGPRDAPILGPCAAKSGRPHSKTWPCFGRGVCARVAGRDARCVLVACPDRASDPRPVRAVALSWPVWGRQDGDRRRPDRGSRWHPKREPRQKLQEAHVHIRARRGRVGGLDAAPGAGEWGDQAAISDGGQGARRLRAQRAGESVVVRPSAARGSKPNILTAKALNPKKAGPQQDVSAGDAGVAGR